MTGRLAHIFRHPIKAHGVESVERIDVAARQTLPWDRRWAVLHEHAKADGTAWAQCANFSRGAKAGTLMAITAVTNESEGTLKLSHPDLPDLTFDPSKDVNAFLAWVSPLMPENRAASKNIVEVPGRGMTDTDFPSISLGNLASLKALSDSMGMTLDPRRFRANFWLEGIEPWQEFDWIGKTISLNSVEFEVAERITRCRATMANPETGETDADTLSALETGWDHQDFGVYLVAKTSGPVTIGASLGGPF